MPPKRPFLIALSIISIVSVILYYLGTRFVTGWFNRSQTEHITPYPNTQNLLDTKLWTSFSSSDHRLTFKHPPDWIIQDQGYSEDVLQAVSFSATESATLIEVSVVITNSTALASDFLDLTCVLIDESNCTDVIINQHPYKLINNSSDPSHIDTTLITVVGQHIYALNFQTDRQSAFTTKLRDTLFNSLIFKN